MNSAILRRYEYRARKFGPLMFSCTTGKFHSARTSNRMSFALVRTRSLIAPSKSMLFYSTQAMCSMFHRGYSSPSVHSTSPPSHSSVTIPHFPIVLEFFLLVIPGHTELHAEVRILDTRWLWSDGHLDGRWRGTVLLVILAINLTAESPKGQLDAYIKNAEWDLEGQLCFLRLHVTITLRIDFSAVNNALKYDCCPTLYPFVLFTIRIRRRSLYYVTNVVGRWSTMRSKISLSAS